MDLLRLLREKSPRTIGIDGNSGAGKSTLARELAEVLGGTVIPYDYFHKIPRKEWTLETDINTFGDAQKLAWVMQRLQAGESFILNDLYNHADGKHTRTFHFESKPVLIVEGIVTVRLPLDFKIFLHVDHEAAMERARVRDIRDLGMTDDLWIIKKHLFHTEYGKLIDELKKKSDVVIDTTNGFAVLV